ncbi:MAG: DHH family phosphoesterase, partial [Candidatus Cloacimonas sp.]|nr:DHH family phosphoesterase [Candidatus Cloacimonas sp.]
MKDIVQQMLMQAQQASRIAITTHVNPDGDGFCAALALQKIIQELGKENLIVTDDDDLERYQFLLTDDSSRVRQFSSLSTLETKQFDLVIVLDCNSYDRIGERRALVDNAKYVAVFDHHVLEHEPINADLSIIEPAYVSAGAIIYELFKPQILSMQEVNRIYVANCIYTTILNDTNNYSNANTNSAVFAIAAELSDIGSKAHELYKEFFMNHAAEEMRYVGDTLATIELHNKRRVLTMYSTMEMMQRNQLNPDSVMNITRWVQGVKGVDR